MLNYEFHKILLPFVSFLFLCSTAQAVVTVTEGSSSVTLDNGIVTAVFDKSMGTVTSLTNADGIDVLKDEGFVYLNLVTDVGGAALWSAGTVSYQVINNTASHVELSFAQPYSSTVSPFDIDLRYVIRDGESGIYWYATCGTSQQNAHTLGLCRLVARCDPEVFNYYRLTDGRFGPLADPSMVYNYSDDMADGVYDGVSSNGAERLVPGEASLLQDGSIDYKYLMHHKADESDVYGTYGTYDDDYYGLWMITPSYESRPGGHSKQSNAVHSSTTTTCLLRLLVNGHYGGGRGLNFTSDEEWTKFFGPFMLYVNTAATADELWNDAKAKAAIERSAFPHSWVDHSDFNADIRTSVTGTLNITDGSSVAGAWVGLVEEDGDDLYWVQAGKGYQYWTQVNADGSFTIEDVRGDGRYYTLYAHVDGVMDEYKQAGIIIPPTGKDLGTVNWTPVKHGKTIWQIGYPDRSAKEYRNGGDLSQWGLWLKFPTDFPNGVNYIIGQSNEATDWNYAQCPVGWTEPYRDCLPDQFTMPDWKITFDFDGDSEYAKGYLTLATVSCSLTDGEFFTVLLNGTEIAKYEGSLANGSPLGLSGAMARTSHYGGVDYRQNVIEFDLSLLQPTNNVITLRSDGDRLDEIMYDCIRLEVKYKADFNNDGKVNLNDFATMASDWFR